jgi:hypothetical protein
MAHGPTYDDGAEVYQFVDGLHGWAVGPDEDRPGGFIPWRTMDGGESWSPVRVV